MLDEIGEKIAANDPVRTIIFLWLTVKTLNGISVSSRTGFSTEGSSRSLLFDPNGIAVTMTDCSLFLMEVVEIGRESLMSRVDSYSFSPDRLVLEDILKTTHKNHSAWTRIQNIHLLWFTATGPPTVLIRIPFPPLHCQKTLCKVGIWRWEKDLRSRIHSHRNRGWTAVRPVRILIIAADIFKLQTIMSGAYPTELNKRTDITTTNFPFTLSSSPTGKH